MKQPALQTYTKQKALYGQNQQQILDKFVQYSATCRDPLTIYKYMQQKSICIYLANYWISRAWVFAQTGDFTDALLCLKQATLRNHIVKQNQINIQQHLSKLKYKIISAIKRYPSKHKRQANQYMLFYQNTHKINLQHLQNVIALFEKNYSFIHQQLCKQFDANHSSKNLSWISFVQKQNQLKIKKISEKIKINSNQDFYSLRTPISKKDPMRLTKTMDSIQMLKKKKSTQQKAKKRPLPQSDNPSTTNQPKTHSSNIDNDSDPDTQNDDTNLLCIHTTPLGRQLSILSRRVTFDTKFSGKFNKIQKIRGNQQMNDDNTSNNSQNNKNQSSADKSKSFINRNSILKNKLCTDQSFHLHQMDQQS